MGILAPLYLAGLTALALPLIFHLVRRTPRGRQDFSSLMFLLPSPPRLTRRSRLDQILLLLLRLAALALLAFAFARPFLREAATLALEDLPARRVAILVDASASMRRGDLWQQAVRSVERELADLNPHDEVALYTFGERLKTEVGFESAAEDAAASRLEIVRQAASKLRPTWEATDLGGALVAAASELDAASDVEQSAAEPQIIVISDFQKGARIDALQGFEWPERVQMVSRPLAAKRATNATVQLLQNEEDGAAGEPRVRVTNVSDARDDQFFVGWTGDITKREGNETAVYVPPGQSRVVKLPRPENLPFADRLALRGDDHDFDNTYFVVPPRKQQVKLIYVGADAADDESGPRYYLHLATSGDPLREVSIEVLEKDDSGPLAAEPTPQIAVVTRKVSPALASALAAFAQRGGTVLITADDAETAEVVPALLDDVKLATDSKPAGEFLLLGEIDFGHPLFVPLANPRYNDFTKIHFWKTVALTVADDAKTNVIARFDNGWPAILERELGEGRVLVLASGLSPDSSQLALSSKFVPIIGALLDRACGTTEALASVLVGQAVALPVTKSTAARAIRRPSGESVPVKTEDRRFEATNEPGIYSIVSGGDEQRFAVNIAPPESNTAALELEQLEQLGVRTVATLTRAERLDRIRQQRDIELESRQKIWRWLIVAAVGVLMVETILAGRAARHIAKQEAGHEQASLAV